MTENGQAMPRGSSVRGLRQYVWAAVFFFGLHAFFMLYRYGQLPVAPVLGDEVIINDAALSLGTGHGYAATSFADSRYGIDHLFAHFPPLYPLTESLAVRAFGISVYSLRLTTTVMSIAANAVFLALLYGLCRSGLVSPAAAMMLGGIYSTFTPLIVVSRMARMESMIELLTLLALWTIFRAVTLREDEGVGRWLVATGLFAGLCMAVHPEAVTSMLILAPLALLAVPDHLGAKVAGAVVAVATPLVICLLTFGKESSLALHQFLDILHNETPRDDTLGQWLASAPHAGNVSALNLNVFFFCVLLLLVLLPVVYVLLVRRLPQSSVRYRVSASFAVSAVLELAAITWGLHVNTRRYEALLGPLLIAIAIAAVGMTPLRRWQSALTCVFIGVQAAGAAAYLHARKDRIEGMNPERFLPVVRNLPPGVSVASEPQLWLALRESGRPFVLLYPGFDGLEKWKEENVNPLQRFDVVILAGGDDRTRALMKDADDGRTECTYEVGGDEVQIYLRGSAIPPSCRSR